MSELAIWSEYPDFDKSEFDCKETGANEMTHHFMTLLQKLRTAYGKSIVPSSGYRSPKHSAEAHKEAPGTHAQGIAVDIPCRGKDAYTIIELGLNFGFKGIGISQKGDKRFIHLDLREFPTIWSY